MNKIFSIFNLGKAYIKGNTQDLTLNKLISILDLFSLNSTVIIVDVSSFNIDFIKEKRIKHIILQDNSILIYSLNKNDVFACLKNINLKEVEIFIYVFNYALDFNKIIENVNYLNKLALVNFDISFYEGTFYIDFSKETDYKNLNEQIKSILKIDN